MPYVTPAELRYLSLAQAGTIANLSTRTLRRAIAAKRLRAYRLGRLTRIELAELRRWRLPPGRQGSPRRYDDLRCTVRGWNVARPHMRLAHHLPLPDVR